MSTRRAWVLWALVMAPCRHRGDRHGELPAAPGLKRLDTRGHTSGGQLLVTCVFQTRQTYRRRVDGAAIFVQTSWLGWGGPPTARSHQRWAGPQGARPVERIACRRKRALSRHVAAVRSRRASSSTVGTEPGGEPRSAAAGSMASHRGGRLGPTPRPFAEVMRSRRHTQPTGPAMLLTSNNWQIMIAARGI
jgi:hypothetical protein